MFWNRVIKIAFTSFCMSQLGGLSNSLSMEVPMQTARLSCFTKVMLARANGERIVKEAFRFEQIYKIPFCKAESFNLSEELSELNDRVDLKPEPLAKERGLIFRVYYQPDRKVGASNEVLNFGETDMFNALFQSLENILMSCPISTYSNAKKPKIFKADQPEAESGDEERGKPEEAIDASSDGEDSEEESDKDYFEATLAVMERVKNAVNDAKLIAIMEKSINEQKFTSGLAATIDKKKEELKRKRSREDLAATISQYIINYQACLSSHADFTINSCVLINGDEGVLTVELSLQDIQSIAETYFLPERLIDLRYHLQQWSVGKLITVHNKQIEKIYSKREENNHSGYFM